MAAGLLSIIDYSLWLISLAQSGRQFNLLSLGRFFDHCRLIYLARSGMYCNLLSLGRFFDRHLSQLGRQARWQVGAPGGGAPWWPLQLSFYPISLLVFASYRCQQGTSNTFYLGALYALLPLLCSILTLIMSPCKQVLQRPILPQFMRKFMFQSPYAIHIC